MALLYPNRIKTESNFFLQKIKRQTNRCFYSVRLFSTKSFKALGTLIYHKAAVQALAFARARPVAVRPHSLHPHHRDHLGHQYHHRPCDLANSAAGGGGGGSGSGLAPGTTACPLRGVPDSGRSGGDDGDGGDGDRVLDYDNQDDGRITSGDGGKADEEAREGEEEKEGEGEGGKEGDGEDDDDDEMGTEEKASRSRWLVSGGKDGRVVVWALMDFASEGHQKERVAP